MPDPTYSQAWLEAYACAPTGQVIYTTLELWHPSFMVPTRLVNDNADLVARIEAGAARDAGAIVTFVGYAFDIVPPEQTSDALPQAVIEFDNNSKDITAAIDAAVVLDTPVTVIWQEYLSNNLNIGPENVPPLELTVTQITALTPRIRCVAGFPNLLDRPFPNIDYELETFPGRLHDGRT